MQHSAGLTINFIIIVRLVHPIKTFEITLFLRKQPYFIYVDISAFFEPFVDFSIIKLIVNLFILFLK